MKLIDAEQCPCYKCGATCPYNNPVGDCKKFSCCFLCYLNPKVLSINACISEYVIKFRRVNICRIVLYWFTAYRAWETDRKSTRLNSSHITRSRMPSSA